MELQTFINIFLAFTAYAITPLSHNTLNLRRFNMTNLMKSLGNQVIKILPSWCFKKEPISQEELEQLQIEPNLLNRSINSANPLTNVLNYYSVSTFTRERLENLAISQNEMLNEREDELYQIQNEERTCFDMHWFWITMYLLGIGTGTMSVLLYQALQSNYNLI